MKRLLVIVLAVLTIVLGARFSPIISNPVAFAQTNTFCANNLACTVSSAWTFNSSSNLIPCVSNGFYLSAHPSCYATVSAAFDAACALSPVGTVTIPPGTYTGPLAAHFCSNLGIMGLSAGESRPAVGNLGVTPLTATTPVTLTYAASLNLSGIQNMRIENVMLDWGSCTGCGFILTSSSFNQFKYVTLNNVGDTGTPALLITVLNGTGAQFGSVWNTFDHLRINCNAAASHYCLSAVEMLGAGTVNAAPAAFATLNHFWDLGVTGQYKYCIDAELNSDTNYFWGVDCNENASPVPTNSAVLAFNLNTPASDQDADGGVYEGVIVAGLGPSSFIRAGQSNGNRISISEGSAGPPSLVNVGGTPLYTVNIIGLPAVNANLYVGGAIAALGSMAASSPGIAGDVTAARASTTGVYYFGTDGGNLNRVGTQLILDGTHMAGLALTEQGANPCSTGVDLIFGNAGTHQMDLCNNSTTFFPVTQTIITGTSTLTANATLGAGTCQTAITTSATGAATTDSIEWSFATAPATGDAISPVASYVTANNVNFTRCNPTAAAQNVTAIVINWRVIR